MTDERQASTGAPGTSVAKLSDLLEQLPTELGTSVFTHASWTARRADSYERLAFLGDSVLALAVTSHLYPRLEADRFGAGRLTKIRAQAVSGRSCRAVAERLGVPERLQAAAPAGGGTERRRAGQHRAGARLGDRGGDRRVLPGLRLRAPRPRPWSGVRARDRRRARASGRLQVGAAGAAGAARGARQLRAWSTSRDRRTTGRSRSAPRSTGSRSAAASGAARRTPSRRLRSARPRGARGL